jgi:hypothetical protein
MADMQLDETDNRFDADETGDIYPVSTDGAEADETEVDAIEDQELGQRGSSRTRKGITKQAAARAIAKYIELTAAPAEHLDVLASSIGAKADPAEIAATIISAPRINLGALNDIAPILDAAAESPYAAMFAVFKLDRDQLKQVWSLLTSVGVASGALPTKDQAAGVAIAEAAAKLGDRERALFESVRSLARK